MSFPWAKPYEPTHPLMKWMDEKLPIPRLVYNATGAANIIATTATGVTGAAYTMVDVNFVTPPSCVSVRIDLMCPAANGGVCYFDDVSLLGPSEGGHSSVTLGAPGWRKKTAASYSTAYTSLYSPALANNFKESRISRPHFQSSGVLSFWQCPGLFYAHGNLRRRNFSRL